MKKRFFAFTLSLLLALSVSACGTQSAAGNGTEPNTPSDPAADGSGLNTPAGTDSASAQDTPTGTDNSDLNLSGIFGMDDSSLSFSSLTDFYDSEYRTLLEDSLNEIFVEAFGLHIFITVEEPDTLIYNYQYTSPLSSVGLSHEDAAAAIALNYQETTASSQMDEVVNSIKTFQSCGLPVKVIRMIYLDADGSLVYSTDITEDYGVSEFPGNSVLPGSSDTTPGVYADLQEWMDSSEDAALTVQSTNQSLTSTGITFDLAVDGSILIYKYYLPDDFFADGLAEEDLTNTFDSMVDAGSASVDAIVSMFMDKYGLTVNAVRFSYYSKNGTELYSRDVTP